jgi:hypothetical protein
MPRPQLPFCDFIWQQNLNSQVAAAKWMLGTWRRSPTAILNSMTVEETDYADFTDSNNRMGRNRKAMR